MNTEMPVMKIDEASMKLDEESLKTTKNVNIRVGLPIVSTKSSSDNNSAELSAPTWSFCCRFGVLQQSNYLL